jgi:hypothetical protein
MPRAPLWCNADILAAAGVGSRAYLSWRRGKPTAGVDAAALHFRISLLWCHEPLE